MRLRRMGPDPASTTAEAVVRAATSPQDPRGPGRADSVDALPQSFSDWVPHRPVSVGRASCEPSHALAFVAAPASSGPTPPRTPPGGGHRPPADTLQVDAQGIDIPDTAAQALPAAGHGRTRGSRRRRRPGRLTSALLAVILASFG